MLLYTYISIAIYKCLSLEYYDIIIVVFTYEESQLSLTMIMTVFGYKCLARYLWNVIPFYDITINSSLANAEVPIR